VSRNPKASSHGGLLDFSVRKQVLGDFAWIGLCRRDNKKKYSNNGLSPN
jgi:hypothetical protein